VSARLSAVQDGPADVPVLVLGPSLGTDTGLLDPQVAELTRTHRVIRYDLRGHGGSEVLVPSRTGTWFTAEWAETEPAAAERLLGMLRATPPRATPPAARRSAPSTSVTGSATSPPRPWWSTVPRTPATTVDMVRLLADGIPDSQFVLVPCAAHLPNATHPEALNAVLRDHFGD
jgi:pimeloyl-ACP methyl ester carboxylesterase